MNLDLIRKRYLQGMAIVILLLALIRLFIPEKGVTSECSDDFQKQDVSDNVTKNSNFVPHRIYSVSNYNEAFPDSNHVQLEAARRWGVSPVKNRKDAEARKEELVYVGFSPYYRIDPLQSSIPYLVPHAAVLLYDIGRAFQDSLYVKGLPLQRIIVTSVLRTEEDVARLRRINRNATEHSCHLYGTTLDITYTRYEAVGNNRLVRDDTLKWVLSEVLRDQREVGRCYVKYERKQSCFHLTVR